MPDKHLSSQFDADLNSLSSRLLEMGGLVESQISTAMRAFTQMDLETCNVVIANEKLVNDLEILIDLACTELIARRQPTARDLRLVMAVSKAITNLERAGDEAERVAKRTKRLDCLTILMWLRFVYPVKWRFPCSGAAWMHLHA